VTATRLALIGIAGALVGFAVGAWWKGVQVGLTFLLVFAVYFVLIEVLMPWWHARAFRRAVEGWRAAPDARAPSPESRYRVTIGTSEIAVESPDGRIERIAVADLQDIRILTNDSGPWGADVWWWLSGSGGRCAFPGGAAGDDAMLRFVQSLPGFDNEAFIAAMGSTGNAEFVCWPRSVEAASGAGSAAI
jgi:hypothetical protein